MVSNGFYYLHYFYLLWVKQNLSGQTKLPEAMCLLSRTAYYLRHDNCPTQICIFLLKISIEMFQILNLGVPVNFPWDCLVYKWHICTLWFSGSSPGKLRKVKVELQENCQILSTLSPDLLGVFLKAIKAAMRDRNLFQELTQKVSKVLLTARIYKYRDIQNCTSCPQKLFLLCHNEWSKNPLLSRSLLLNPDVSFPYPPRWKQFFMTLVVLGWKQKAQT